MFINDLSQVDPNKLKKFNKRCQISKTKEKQCVYWLNLFTDSLP